MKPQRSCVLALGLLLGAGLIGCADKPEPVGVHWTGDAGKSWHRLNVPGPLYYPRSVQPADGRIYIFAHRGGDNACGSVDQYIVMDTFRLGFKQ